MRKLTLTSLLVLAMIGVPLSAFATRVIDSPHMNLDSDSFTPTATQTSADTEDCSTCHVDMIDMASARQKCVGCHTNTTGAGYNDGSAPFVQTHQGAAPAFECVVCHNPHISKQYANTAFPVTALVSGSITSATSGVAADGTKILTLILDPVVSGTWTQTPHTFADWAQKSEAGRGLTLWVQEGIDAVGNPNVYSFEVNSVTSATEIAVKGVLPNGVTLTFPKAFEMHYGQLVATKIGVDKASVTYDADLLALQTYRKGFNNITFTDNDSFTNPTGSDGVCQVCHTKTAYWTNDGTGNAHNVGARCTTCHAHGSGFMVTSCNACHPGQGLDGVPTALAELAVPATGSATAGAHQLHAIDYGYQCGICHNGTGMDRLVDPNTIVKGDGIQIGFNAANMGGHLTKYNGQSSVAATAGYVGTNNTTVTATGVAGANNLNCSNIYCHSTGQSIRVGCITTLPDTTPPWDGDMNGAGDPQVDGVRCNNCHGYTSAVGDLNPMITGSHTTHIGANSCSVCHANTTTDGVTISATGKATYHANGTYDIAPSGADVTGDSIELTYDPNTRTCSPVAGQSKFAIGCHAARAWAVLNDPAPSTCPDVCGAPVPVTSTDSTLLSGAINYDPIQHVTAVQVSRNTVRFTDTTYDPDGYDLVKNGCFGGGHDGSPGWGRVTKSTAGKMIPTPVLDGSPYVFDLVLDDPVLYNTTDFPGQTVFWYQYQMTDNNPLSRSNTIIKTANDPLLEPIDGYVDSPWSYVVLDPNFDDSQTNVLAEPTHTTTVVDLGGGSYKLTINPQIIDPDAYDLTKNTLFGGHGHDKTVQAVVKMYWGGPTSLHRAILDNSNPNVAWDQPMEYVYTGKSPGNALWYYVEILDSHLKDSVSNTAYPTTRSGSGWKFVTAP